MTSFWKVKCNQGKALGGGNIEGQSCLGRQNIKGHYLRGSNFT